MCKLSSTQPELMEAIVAEYDAVDRYEALVVPRYRRIATGLLAIAGLEPLDCVLEIGAGTGLLTRLMLPAQTKLVFTDINYTMLCRARVVLEEVGLTPTPSLVTDARRLPFRSSLFDVVVGNLAPVADTKHAVLEAARVLRSGGRIVLSMWGPSYSEMRLNNKARRLSGKSPAPYGATRKAVARLQQAGFAVDRFDERYDVEHENVSSYLAYRKSFGSPPGWSATEALAYFEALSGILREKFQDGSVRLGWNVSYLLARRVTTQFGQRADRHGSTDRPRG
jgi:ubiquinone/menaquinone biosynthesis C-methylase UbiE